MPVQGPPDTDLERLASSDRVARAAMLWLRQETARGVAAAPGTRARHLLAAGLVQRLCEHLALGRATALMAGYALALLDAEVDMALGVPREMVRGGNGSTDFEAGLQAADALVLMLRETDPAA